MTSSLPSAYSTRVCSAAFTSVSLDASLGRTSTTVSVRSLAMIRTSPTASVERGGDRFGGVEGRHGGVLLRRSGSKSVGGVKRTAGRSADPAGVGLAEPAAALRRAAVAVVARERGGGGADEPGVDRQPLAAGGLLDAGLELLGQAEVDPRRGALVGRPAARAAAPASARPARPARRPAPASRRSRARRPRRRSSTEPGARSRVISSAAADSASSSVSRIADSSGAVRRSASARASSPPASAATASSRRRFSTYGVRSMAPVWHHYGTHCKANSGATVGSGLAPWSDRRFCERIAGVSRSLRLIACVTAVAALGAAVLVVVMNALVASRGEESWSAVAVALFVLGVAAPACVGLFLVLRRPRTLVAWILLVGALSVGVVMGAFGVAALALDERSRFPARRLGAARGAGMAGAVRLAARARLLLPRRPAAVAALAAGRGVRVRLVWRRDAPAARPGDAGGPVRRRAESARPPRRERAVDGGLLGVLGRRTRLAVRRRARVACPLQGRRPRPAPTDPVARVRRVAGAALARRNVALGACSSRRSATPTSRC